MSGHSSEEEVSQAQADADLACLESLDIDADFNIWQSFRASFSSPSSDQVSRSDSITEEDEAAAASGGVEVTKGGRRSVRIQPVALTKDEKNDLRKWATRVNREEVYSRYYRPVPREKREMQELASFLGLSNNRGAIGIGSKFMDMLNLKDEVESKDDCRPTVSTIFFPRDDEPKSTLLKRGPILLRGPEMSEQGERELILVTRGFIIATVSQQEAPRQSENVPPPPVTGSASPSFKKVFGKIPTPLQKKLIKRKFESCDALGNVSCVEDLAMLDPDGAGGYDEQSFAISVREGDGRPRRRLVFTCVKDEHKAAWIEALEISVVQARVLGGFGGDVGWQHEVLRTSLFSAAVRNDGAMIRKALASSRCGSNINALDSYGGYTALHYAAMRNHLHAMEILLKAGANANALDSNKRDPMYYVERSKFCKAADLLEAHGGVKSPERDGTSELFGAAAQAIKTSVGIATKGNTSAAARETETKAKGAAGAMSEAMSALRERGERLEKLDEKTANLQSDASEYRDLAKQMKEKAKKQNKFLFM